MVQIEAKSNIETAPAFDRGWSIAQIVLNWIVAVILCAGLAGLFGGGPLATTTVRVGQFEVTYDRLVRKTVPLKIRLRPIDKASDDQIRVTVGQDLIDKAGVLRTIPPATASFNTASGTEFVFPATPGQRAETTISVQPDGFGWFHWTLAVAGQGEVSLFQIIYP